MTQLPEVEILRKDLEREIVGKKIKDANVRHAGLLTQQRNRPEFYKALDGRKITAVQRRGTGLLLELDDSYTLLIKLGEQGTVTRETAAASGDASTQLIISFTTGGAVHYSAPEKDGQLAVVPTEEVGPEGQLLPAGIDPLADQFTWHAFSRQLIARQSGLKQLLVDETFLLGLGNLYADEILWAAGLAPTRQSHSLSAQEVRRLYRAILEILYEAVKQGGTAEPEPEEDEPDSGDFGDYIKVYGRENLPCARCRQPIAHSDVAEGVTAYHCPNCQT